MNQFKRLNLYKKEPFKYTGYISKAALKALIQSLPAT